MRIDTSIPTPANYTPAQAPATAKVPDIRVSFDPVMREDMSSKGMLSWMQRQLGVGAQVDLRV
ncbi:MAG: hypothetical protein JWM80_1293 [Cyanobacteria bacterium RYN_339]|nr:hypothetical protein [Cyanobacteria bacterium RYN_339]